MTLSFSLQRLTTWELVLCRAANRVSQRRAGWLLFATISRLGDGLFWYVLLGLLPIIYGPGEMRAMLHLFGVGVVSVALYKGIKVKTSRPRPYQIETRIRRGIVALDQYSFPSGHTLHAVAFSIVALTYHPGLDWVIIPFTTLVALSRVVLGLHYPSDVLVGAGLGASIAFATLEIMLC